MQVITLLSDEDYQPAHDHNIKVLVQTNENLHKLETVLKGPLSRLEIVNEGYIKFTQQGIHEQIKAMQGVIVNELSWRSGANNNVLNNESIPQLAEYLSKQKLKSLQLHFDSTDQQVQVQSILLAIEAIETLESLDLYFEDDIAIDAGNISKSLRGKQNLKHLKLNFGQKTINGSWEETAQVIEQLQLQSLGIHVSLRNTLHESFHTFLAALRKQTQLTDLTLSLSVGVGLTSAMLLSLNGTLSQLPSLSSLTLILNDTRHFDQELLKQLCDSIGSIPRLDKLSFSLGNNTKSMESLPFSMINKHLNTLTMNFGYGWQIITDTLVTALAQAQHLKIIDIKSEKGIAGQNSAMLALGKLISKFDSFQLQSTEQFTDCDLLGLVSNLQPTNGQKIQIINVNKLLNFNGQSIELRVEQIPTLGYLFQSLELCSKVVKNIKLNVRHVKFNSEDIIKVVQCIKQSQLSVLILTIKRIPQFRCSQMTNLFSSLIQSREWKFLSIEVQTVYLQQIMRTNNDKLKMAITVAQSQKFGGQGEEYMVQCINATKLKQLSITIMNINNLTQKGFRDITLALINQNDLCKVEMKVADTNPSVNTFIQKMIAVVQQKINDVKRFAITYGAVLQKQEDLFNSKFNTSMIEGTAQYLVDDVTIPVVQALQPHQQQYAFGNGFKSNKFEELFAI